jgi:hypothetical protein
MKSFNPIVLARNAPWVFMAIAFHAILFAIAAVWYVKHEQKIKEEKNTQISISKPREDQPEELVQPPEVIDRKAIPKNEDAELVSFEEDIYIPTTEAQPEDLHLDRGDPTALDNLPSGGTTGGTAIGVGEGGHYGIRPSAFGGRKLGSGPRKGRAGGPTQGTEKAVLDGLRWLVRHQNPDGSWGALSLKSRCIPEAPCYDAKLNMNDHYDEGLTGLALLCFLGAGFSHESKQDIVDTALAKRYKVGEVVKKALENLRKKQNPDGSFSRDRAFMYNEALATMAMTEAFGLSQNRYWKEPAQRGINFIEESQRPNPSGQGFWGWRYASRKEIEDFRKGTGDDTYKKDLFDSDTSVTTWCVMALKSAQLSGLQVKQESMDGAMEFCKFVTANDGLVGYLDAKSAGATVTGPFDSQFTYHSTTMSALGMCLRIFATHNPDDPFLELAAKRILTDLPTVSKDRSSIDYYYWYYASLAMNQLDGPDSPKKSGKYWGPWNKAMVDAVLSLQDHTERACTNGGWIQSDRWGNYSGGGPLYNTAINVLTLEVYYRYENAFGGSKRN